MQLLPASRPPSQPTGSRLPTALPPLPLHLLALLLSPLPHSQPCPMLRPLLARLSSLISGVPPAHLPNSQASPAALNHRALPAPTSSLFPNPHFVLTGLNHLNKCSGAPPLHSCVTSFPGFAVHCASSLSTRIDNRLAPRVPQHLAHSRCSEKE